MLITRNVSAGTYYIKITSSSGSSSSYYKLRTKLTPAQPSITVDEREPNNTYRNASSIADDQSKYSYISYNGDEDWWKITFTSGGTANFYLGNIPSGCNYDLYLYSSNGSTLLKSSVNSGTANELITYNVSVNTFYYIKIIPRSGYSTSSSYLLRAKLYPTQSQTTVNVESKNNTAAMAKNIVEDTDNYGYISSARDVNWWKITFTSSGTANFYLGNIPSGCNYDLRLYSSNGTTLLKSSAKNGNADELITYNVSANTLYYIKIIPRSGYSTTSSYLLRAKLYPTKTITSVPLYEQQTEFTCGPACALMILRSYGVTTLKSFDGLEEKSIEDAEEIFKNEAWRRSGGAAEVYTDRMYITQAINYYLSTVNNAPKYKYKYFGELGDDTATTFNNLMWRNIAQGYPVQIKIATNKTGKDSYFPYSETDGHFLVLKGLSYSQSTGYAAILNDPHYNDEEKNKIYCRTLTVPIDKTWNRITEWDGNGADIIYVVD